VEVVVTHEQTGRAHFSAFEAAIFFSPASNQKRAIQKAMLVTENKGSVQKWTLLVFFKVVQTRLTPTLIFLRGKIARPDSQCLLSYSGQFPC